MDTDTVKQALESLTAQNPNKDTGGEQNALQAKRTAITGLQPEAVARMQEKMIAAGYLPRNPASHAKLAAYLVRPLVKGLVIWGDVGTGKTLFFEKFRPSVRICQARRMLAAAHGEIEAGANTSMSLVIDDLGKEPTMHEYGETSEALADIICARYLSFQRYRTFTHITTELNPKQIAARYGARVLDRLREMCYFHHLTGRSARGEQ
jgi:predicted ATPase